MGKQNSTYTFDGKVGNVVGMTDKKGQKTVRLYTKPKNPQTENQIFARTRFLTATGLATSFGDALAGLAPAAAREDITTKNLFVRLNGSGPNDGQATIIASRDAELNVVTAISWPNIIIAQGKPANTQANAPSFAESQAASLKISGLTEGDILHLVGYNEDTAKAYQSVALVTSNQQTFTLANLPANLIGRTMHLWYYTQRLADANARWTYLSYYNGNSVAATALRRTITASEKAADYSNSIYAGSGTIG